MGRIIKYNIAKGDDGERIKSVVFGSASSAYPTYNGSESTDREMSVNLWGNDFHGVEDLSGSIKVVNGDIYITFDEDDFDPEEYEEEDIVPSGSLYVDGKIQAPTGNITTVNSTTVNGNDIKGNDLYLNYPDATSAKQNLRPLLKGFDTRITNNATNITNLDGRLTQAEKDIRENEYIITEVQGDVVINQNRITELEDKLKNINTKVDDVDNKVDNIDQDTTSPVILFSGTLVSDNNNSDKTWQPWTIKNGAYHKGVSGLELWYYSETNNWPALAVSINTKSGYSSTVYSVTGVVKKTSNYDVSSSATGGNPRSQGYWMTGGIVSNNTALLAAWRTQDDNNDSVRYDCIAYRCQEINVTVFGTISKN